MVLRVRCSLARVWPAQATLNQLLSAMGSIFMTSSSMRSPSNTSVSPGSMPSSSSAPSGGNAARRPTCAGRGGSRYKVGAAHSSRLPSGGWLGLFHEKR